MFYLTIHPTHFNLWLYGIKQMVKDHPYYKRGNSLSYFQVEERDLLYASFFLVYTTFVTPVVEHWLEQEMD